MTTCPKTKFQTITEPWNGEFSATYDDLRKRAFREVCEKYGVPGIADLRENDPEE